MTFTELYNDIVSEINKIDLEIKYLQGKREAYNSMRLDLFNAVEYERKQREQRDNTTDKEESK